MFDEIKSSLSMWKETNEKFTCQEALVGSLVLNKATFKSPIFSI